MTTLTKTQEEQDALFKDKYGAFESSGIVSAGGQENFLEYAHSRDLDIEAATRLEIYELLHTYAMQTQDTHSLDFIEKLQSQILSALTGINQKV